MVRHRSGGEPIITAKDIRQSVATTLASARCAPAYTCQQSIRIHVRFAPHIICAFFGLPEAHTSDAAPAAKEER
jgi:hypothetical protein